MNGNVLILNQNYEPMSVCSVQKAIILLILKKAELVERKDGKILRSPSRVFPYPSIIRLSLYIKIPYKRAVLSRKNIFRRDSFRCQYCGKYDSNLTLDHIIPKSRKGEDSWENLVTACIECNNKKGDRSPEDAKMALLTRPRRPNHVMFIKHSHGDIDDKWKPYLFMMD